MSLGPYAKAAICARAQEMEGVWVIVSWDRYPYVQSIHNDELEARRKAESYEFVYFVRFNQDFREELEPKKREKLDGS